MQMMDDESKGEVHLTLNFSPVCSARSVLEEDLAGTKQDWSHNPPHPVKKKYNDKKPL